MLINNAAWNTLLNYESHDLIKQRCKEVNGYELNATNIKEISSNFVQARAYFTSAYNADYTIKPLLLYYGLTSLCRGSILFLKRNREASLSQGHGLSASRWKSFFGQDSYNLADLYIETNTSGTLIDFINASQNKTPLRLGSNAITHVFEHSLAIKNNTYKISLGDILSRVPDISIQYSRTGNMLNCFSGGIEPNDGEMNIKIRKRQIHRTISNEDIFKSLKDIDSDALKEDQDFFIVKVKTNYPLILWDHVDENLLGMGSLFVVSPFANSFDISKPAATYILSYILGMLARYYPSKWMSLIRNEKGDALMPSLLKSLSYIENKFPQTVVDLLETPKEAETIKYG